MGRKPKFQWGQTRTILLRKYQIEQIDETAERFGCDFSDVVRATVDMLLPSDPRELRVRSRAALERNYRRLTEFSMDLIPVVLHGWKGREMMLPMEIAKKPAIAGLMEETVSMLRRYKTLPSEVRDEDRISFPHCELSSLSLDLLVVLSSPAVRVLEYLKKDDNLPSVFLASSMICPVQEKSGKRIENEAELLYDSGPAETQYEEPSAALAELVKTAQVEDVTRGYLGQLGAVLRCSAFKIDWKRSREHASRMKA